MKLYRRAGGAWWNETFSSIANWGGVVKVNCGESVEIVSNIHKILTLRNPFPDSAFRLLKSVCMTFSMSDPMLTPLLFFHSPAPRGHNRSWAARGLSDLQQFFWYIESIPWNYSTEHPYRSAMSPDRQVLSCIHFRAFLNDPAPFGDIACILRHIALLNIFLQNTSIFTPRHFLDCMDGYLYSSATS